MLLGGSPSRPLIGVPCQALKVCHARLNVGHVGWRPLQVIRSAARPLEQHFADSGHMGGILGKGQEVTDPAEFRIRIGQQ